MKLNEETFQKHGIANSSLIDIKKFNLIIGKNGAGKTRLLKAIKEGIDTPNTSVIYAYFPEMHANYKESFPENEFEIPLYEIIFEGENIEFNNFVSYIEQHGYAFLIELLRDLDGYANYRRSVRRTRATNIQDDLNKILEILINRKLLFKSEICVESLTYHTTKPLIDDLKAMSPGELMLFYLAILLIIVKHNKNSNEKMILLLDEPELHLHPKALITFLDYLRQEDSIEICCIATHSIFLVPLYDFYEIIYVENSEIQHYNSQLYSNIYEDIIGKNGQLTDFLQSRDMWKYYQFIAECFCLPSTVNKMDEGDEQFVKFLNYINTLRIHKKEISVLDYGAGEGRLGKALQHVTPASASPLVRYYYYDKYREKPDDLKCQSFKSIQEIQNSFKNFNCVVLMNVLHEIEVKEWVKSFSDIYNILENGGYVLIFEVHSLLHGEQPYGDTGYILLNEKQVCELFNTQNIKKITINDSDKTNLFVIEKNCLRNVSDVSVLNALNSLRKSLYTSLKEQYIYRKKAAHTNKKTDYNLIKSYGFLSQHYLNSIFAIESITGKSLASLDMQTTPSHKQIDYLMSQIDEAKTGQRLDFLREQLLTFTSDKDKQLMLAYLENGSFHQRKSARFYFQKVKKW